MPTTTARTRSSASSTRSRCRPSSQPAPRRARLRRETLRKLPQVHPRAVRHGAGHRADRLGQDDDALRGAPRSSRRRTRSSPSRTRSSTSCAGDHPDPGQREEGADLRARAALDPAPRPRQDHGRRDPRRGDRLIAIQSALTGHLVFTTVHANNVIDVLGRFLNMKVDLYNFVSALNCVLAQRLVRTHLPALQAPSGGLGAAARGVGARPGALRACRSTRGPAASSATAPASSAGPRSRELLDLTDNIRELILDRRPGAEIKRRGQGGGDALPARVGARKGARRMDDAA
jgi:hypothetical protein